MKMEVGAAIPGKMEVGGGCPGCHMLTARGVLHLQGWPTPLPLLRPAPSLPSPLPPLHRYPVGGRVWGALACRGCTPSAPVCPGSWSTAAVAALLGPAAACVLSCGVCGRGRSTLAVPHHSCSASAVLHHSSPLPFSNNSTFAAGQHGHGFQQTRHVIAAPTWSRTVSPAEEACAPSCAGAAVHGPSGGGVPCVDPPPAGVDPPPAGLACGGTALWGLTATTRPAESYPHQGIR